MSRTSREKHGYHGVPISLNVNGERSEKTTAPEAQRGIIFHTIMLGRELTVGAKMVSRGFQIQIKDFVSVYLFGMEEIQF